jgi:hypothetical protein
MIRLLVVGLVIVGLGCTKTVGTETGNPPVIAASLVEVEAVDDEHVRVSGEAGAIEPGGGEVSVTNTTRGGEPVVVDVAEDGSFSVELEGDPDDHYEIVATNDEGSSPPRIVHAGPVEPIDWQTLHACDDADPSDPLMVTRLEIEGDTLHVDVSHGGGCEEHGYGLCYEEAWAASSPIQVGFRVLHDDGGDSCDALLNQQLSFDLTPFKQAYAELMGGDAGAAGLGFEACELDGDPTSTCRVLYEWGDLANACGPPITPACPPFELPAAPDTWVAYPTTCQFSFRAPEGLTDLDAQGTDSCVDELENDDCTFNVGSGGFSGGLTDFEDADEYRVGQAAIDGYDAMLVTAVRPGEPRPYAAGAHFPNPPFALEPNLGVSADLLILCTTREQRDAMLAVLGTIRFD